MTDQKPQHDGRGQPEEGSTADGSGRETAGGDTGDTGDGAWEGIVLDEDFVRDAGTAEPSARARMLAARWRCEKPEPQPWRSDEPPAGWFFSKGRRRGWRRR
ncbi:hypothetical protein [Streptomyces sp. BK79]|uniref:SGM_3592 family protein n=1 Tax=Streptomyces sp. BK79 TaxID=3350097 RepID=UPI00376FC2CC